MVLDPRADEVLDADGSAAFDGHVVGFRSTAGKEYLSRSRAQQFSYFLDRVSSMKEGDKSLLDNSIMLFGSSLRDGDKHRDSNLPIVLAGSGGGKLNTGQNIAYKEDTPLANLLTTREYLETAKSYTQ